MISLQVALAGFSAADEKFIHFYTVEESFTILANGSAAQLLQPDPCRAAAVEAKQLFEINGIDPGLSHGEPLLCEKIQPISRVRYRLLLLMFK